MTTKTVRFTSGGSSSTFGNFAPGDVLRGISAEHARHLVEDARCAVYVDGKPTDTPSGAEATHAALTEGGTTELPPGKAPATTATPERTAAQAAAAVTHEIPGPTKSTKGKAAVGTARKVKE